MDKTFIKLKKELVDLYNKVKEDSLKTGRPNHGHGLDHDITVAMLSIKIAPNKKVAEMAFVASLFHSTDRRMGKRNIKKTSEIVQNYLKLI